MHYAYKIKVAKTRSFISIVKGVLRILNLPSLHHDVMSSHGIASMHMLFTSFHIPLLS